MSIVKLSIEGILTEAQIKNYLQISENEAYSLEGNMQYSNLAAALKHEKASEYDQASRLYNLSKSQTQNKADDWLLADTCPQAANYCALF